MQILLTTGGQLQSVRMQPIPRLSVKTCGGGGGGGSWGGGGSAGGGGGIGSSAGGRGCARPTTTTCIPLGCVCVSGAMGV